MRSVARFSRLGIPLGAAVLVLVTVSPALAAPLVTILPPFPPASSTVLANPTTWAILCGNVSWPNPPAASIFTGNSSFDEHANSCGPGGTWGSDATEAGFNVSYMCTGPCATGPGTYAVATHWTRSWFVNLQLTCQPGEVNVTFTGHFEILLGNTILAGPTVFTMFTKDITTPATIHAGNTSQRLTGILHATLLPGITYNFVTWSNGYVYTHCGENSLLNTKAFGEVDEHNPGWGQLNSITIT